MYFEVVTKTTAKGKTRHHARIKSANGDILFASQNYKAKASAKHVCEIVKGHAADAPIVEVTE